MKSRKIIFTAVLVLIFLVCLSSILWHGKYFNRIAYKTNCSYSLPDGWHLVDTNGCYLLKGDLASGPHYMYNYCIVCASPYGDFAEASGFLDSCNAKGAFEQFKDHYFEIKKSNYSGSNLGSGYDSLSASVSRLKITVYFVGKIDELQRKIIEAYQNNDTKKANKLIKLHNKYVDSLHNH